MKRLLRSACLLILLIATSVIAAAQAGIDDAKNIFEIRVYTITPGSMDAFIKWMDGVTRSQESVGMQSSCSRCRRSR